MARLMYYTFLYAAGLSNECKCFYNCMPDRYRNHLDPFKQVEYKGIQLEESEL